MRLLLPPSETKRDGGVEGTSLDLGALAFPSLTRQRRAALAALARLSRSVAESTRVLGLGATQRHEIDRNRAVRASPTMPAIDRYTGVLYDALDASTLPEASREWLAAHVVVQSALLGMTGALDPIPAYRLSASSRLPGVRLVELWSGPVSAIAGGWRGLVLDLRSEAYAALGPAPSAVYVRVVTRESDGKTRALNHGNKTAKGELARALAEDGPTLDSLADFRDWASSRGFVTAEADRAGNAREIRLVV